MRPYDWYDKAKKRVEQFISDLDKELEVEVDEIEITPNDGSPSYEASVLTFSHPSNPNLHWTMEVQLSDEFIENELEEVVRRIYFQRVE